MVGETPNIDRIGHEGAKFMDYLAMQSCTSGRNAFFTSMYPVRDGWTVICMENDWKRIFRVASCLRAYCRNAIGTAHSFVQL
jgi:arylsulfatase A-like enzyme